MNPRSNYSPMPSSDWPINTYWTESPERVSQHWYITFCLLMSAIHDYLTGMVLAQQNNLNWAITCCYYSMVHTGRMFVFITVGDFPKRHDHLQKLFSKNRRPIQGNSIQGNWLKGFPDSYQPVTSIDLDDTSIDLDDMFNMVDGSISFDDFGCGLEALGALRNDSNYEALLIANEHNNQRVTALFREMDKAAEELVKQSVKKAIAKYRNHLEGHSMFSKFSDERSIYFAISNKYVRGQSLPGIKNKIASDSEAGNELIDLIQGLIFSVNKNLENTNSFYRIEDHVTMGYFSGKNSLFNNVAKKVRTLEECSLHVLS